MFGDFLRLSVQRLLRVAVVVGSCHSSRVCHRGDCNGGHGDVESGKESTWGGGSVLGGGVERVVQIGRIADKQERRGLRSKPAGAGGGERERSF